MLVSLWIEDTHSCTFSPMYSRLYTSEPITAPRCLRPLSVYNNNDDNDNNLLSYADYTYSFKIIKKHSTVHNVDQKHQNKGWVKLNLTHP